MPRNAADDNPSTAVERALGILEAIAQHPGMTNAEISRKLRIPKSSASYLLRTLERAGYLRREREGGCHLHVLRGEQQLTPVAAIGDDAADEREEEDGQFAEEGVEAEEKRRRRAGHRQDQPVLRDLLHPRADGGRERPEPEHAEISIGERGHQPGPRRG